MFTTSWRLSVLDKLAARGISADKPPRLRHERYVVVHNPRDPDGTQPRPSVEF